jgi:hypothetical protein
MSQCVSWYDERLRMLGLSSVHYMGLIRVAGRAKARRVGAGGIVRPECTVASLATRTCWAESCVAGIGGGARPCHGPLFARYHGTTDHSPWWNAR